MLKLFIALFGLILVYWIYKKKKQLFVRHPQVEPVITTLEAYELQSFLDATTPLVCLEADGQKFGQQYKEKSPPELPHINGCKCQIIQIYYTSSDVFQGESQENLSKPSSLGNINARDARILKQLLLQSHQSELYKDFDTMISDFDANQISEGNRDEIMALSKKAFQLRQNPAEQESS